MGDWIKDNKFEAGLFVVVLFCVIGAYLVGGKAGTRYKEHKDYYDSRKAEKVQLESRKPYPNRENAEEFEEKVADYGQVIDGLQTKLLAFRPKEFKQIAPPEFAALLNTAIEELAKRYTEAGIEFPADQWRLGFERYTETPPRDDATAYLSYQLEALKWLFNALADSRPSALINVYRGELPVEKGVSMDGETNEKPARRNRGKSRAPAVAEKPYYTLPVELTFKAPEPAVRKLISTLVGNKNYYFVIRSLRIQNEKRDQAPGKEDVDFKDAAPAGDAFLNTFDLVVPEEGDPGETPAPGKETPPPADQPAAPVEDPALPGEEEPPIPGEGGEAKQGGSRILAQVLGAEEVFVFLQLDLVLFKEKDGAEAD